MALEGTIKDFGLPDIFQLIGLQRKTGLLTLKTDRDQIVVTFEGGMVVNADSSSKRVEDKLGNVLVKQGKISKEQLDEALSIQKATLQRLGHILVSQNSINQQDLREALQVQVSQLVFRVFRWRDGLYHFEPQDSVDYDRQNFSGMSADFILMEGIRMVDEWPIIEKKIPSMDIVFRPAVDPRQIEVAGGDDGDDMFGGMGGDEGKKSAPSAKIRLSIEEEKIFRRVDGKRTVQAIIDASGMTEFDACRILFDLLNRNLISQVGRGEAQVADARPTVMSSPVPGYVLLGVAVVAALAGLAAQLGTPFGVAGVPPLFRPTADGIRENVARLRLERIDASVLAFRLAHGSLPASLDDLVASGLVGEEQVRDPWGRPYTYAPGPGGYQLSAETAEGGQAAVIDRVFAN